MYAVCEGDSKGWVDDCHNNPFIIYIIETVFHSTIKSDYI